MRGTIWPIHGLGVFLKHPVLWRRPLAALLVGWVLLLAAGGGVGWWWWPPGPANIWPWPLHVGIALGLAVAATQLAWILILPLVMSFALEHLAREVQRQAGATPASEESILAALGSSLHMLLRTLPLRLGWTGAAVLSSFFGPLGILVGAFGMAHLACLDSFDLALAVRGIPGKRRRELLRAHRDDVIQGAMAGAVMNLGLGVTVLGWLLWLPALVAGASVRVLGWDEVKGLGVEKLAVGMVGREA
jgi:hypothetical protein